jgi:hypothetical protein
VLTDFKATPTVSDFMGSPALVRILVGPLGAGKSAACIFELFRRACEQAPDARGVRVTRFALIRNTLQQLRSTTLADVQNYFGDLFDWRVSENAGYFRFVMDDGTRVESQWRFIPLEDIEDVRRLLSLQLTGAFIEECREVDFGHLVPLLGRCGRFPRGGGVEPTWSGVIGCTNPWSDGSEWHEALEIARPARWALFRQPSGLSDEAENLNNLPGGVDYYERLMEGATEQFIRIYVHGENGIDLSGRAVFADSFDPSWHVRWGLRVRERHPVIIGLDTDRHPAAVLMQQRENGGVSLLHCLSAEGMGLELFVSQVLKPVLYERFALCPVVLVIDPSAAKRSSITEESQLGALHRLGLDAALAPTNKLDPRLRVWDEWLTKGFRGEPALIIDGEFCSDLVLALGSRYRYSKNSAGQIQPTPEKLHPASDLVDAGGYGLLGVASAGRGKTLAVRRRFQTSAPSAPPVGGWT